MVRRDHATTRRTAIKTIGGVAVGSALAGCSGNDSGGSGDGDSGSDSSGDSASGADFPTDDVEIIIPYGEGGSTDTVVRNLLPAFEPALGTEVVVNNISGGETVPAQLELASAEPDGHTIMATSHPGVFMGYLIRQPDEFDASQFRQIGTMAQSNWVLATNPDEEVEGYQDLLDRFDSGEFETITTSILGSLHLLLRVIRSKHGLENYRLVSGESSQAQAERVANGEIDATMSGFAGIVDLYEEGLIDIPFAFHSEGIEGFDFPSIVEEGFEPVDNVAVGRRTLQTQSGVDDEPIEIMSDALETTLQDDEVQAWADETGTNLVYQSPEEAQGYYDSLAEEIPEIVDFEAMQREAEEAAE